MSGKNRFVDFLRSRFPADSLQSPGQDPGRRDLSDSPGQSPERGDFYASAQAPRQDPERGNPPDLGDDPERCLATAEELNKAAVAAAREGREEAAERLFKAALLKEPGHLDSFFNLQLLQMRSGQKSAQEAYRALEEDETSKKAGVSAQIIREWGTSPEPVRAENREIIYRSEERLLQPLADGEEIRFLSDQGGLTVTRRFHLESGERLGLTNLGVRSKDREIRCAAFRPGTSCYFTVFGSGLLLVFDMAQGEILQEKSGLEIHQRTGREGTRISFSPDGSMAVISEPRYRDRGSARTIILRASTLEVIADLKKQFVCMPRRGGCLVRGKTDAERGPKAEALFLVEEDGIPGEVFRFESAVSEAHEFDQPPAPFLGYFCKKTDSYFLVDEQFRKIPLTKEIFEGTGRTVFYDPEKGRLYTTANGNRLDLWDLQSREKLCSFEIPYRPYNGLWNDPFLRRSEDPFYLPRYIAGVRREADSWKVTTAYAYRHVTSPQNTAYEWDITTLPDWNPPRRAEWRLSPPEDPAHRSDRLQRARQLAERFDAFARGGNLTDAYTVYCEYRDIPGVYGTGEQRQMEAALDAAAGKRSIHRVHPRGEIRELPLFCMGKEVEYSACAGGLIALTGRAEQGLYVSLFRGDGTLLRRLWMPETVRYAAVRGDRIYGFCKDSDCVLMDLEGNRLPLPWEDWPQEQTYYDLSADGSLLLYLEKKYPIYGSSAYIHLKNLNTGEEIRPSYYQKYGDWRILNDRRIVVRLRKEKKLRTLDTRTGKETEFISEENCQSYAADREQDILIVAVVNYNSDVKKMEGLWRVYSGEGTLLGDWKEDCLDITGLVLVPRSRILVYTVETGENFYNSKYELRVRNLTTGEILFSRLLREEAGPFVRPDGLEIYAAYKKGGYEAWALEYNYE